MHLYIQHALAHPTDWQRIEAGEWKNLPAKPAPDGSEIIDDTPGWVHAVNVQGVIFQRDHIAVQPYRGGIRVTAWNDDPEDWSDDDMDAVVWTFDRPAHDPNIGTVNTVQHLTVYAQGANAERWAQQSTTGGPVIVKPRSDFRLPPVNLIRHGVWLPSPKPVTPASVNERHRGIFPDDDGVKAHRLARAEHGWEEWR